MKFIRSVRYRTIYIFLSILLILLIVLSTRVGAVNLTYSQIFDFFLDLAGKKPNNEINPILEGLFFQIRLPRTFLCFMGRSSSIDFRCSNAIFIEESNCRARVYGTSAGSVLLEIINFCLREKHFICRSCFSGDLFYHFQHLPVG